MWGDWWLVELGFGIFGEFGMGFVIFHRVKLLFVFFLVVYLGLGLNGSNFKGLVL